MVRKISRQKKAKKCIRPPDFTFESFTSAPTPTTMNEVVRYLYRVFLMSANDLSPLVLSIVSDSLLAFSYGSDPAHQHFDKTVDWPVVAKCFLKTVRYRCHLLVKGNNDWRGFFVVWRNGVWVNATLDRRDTRIKCAHPLRSAAEKKRFVGLDEARDKISQQAADHLKRMVWEEAKRFVRGLVAALPTEDRYLVEEYLMVPTGDRPTLEEVGKVLAVILNRPKPLKQPAVSRRLGRLKEQLKPMLIEVRFLLAS